VARVAHVHIEPAIVIDIYHYRPGAPHTILFHTAFGSNILKFEIAFVEIQLVLIHVRSKQYVGQAIVVYIANSYATAIIKVTVSKYVKIFCVLNLIEKIDACISFKCKERGFFFCTGKIQEYD
jgi:hypothetical protein